MKEKKKQKGKNNMNGIIEKQDSTTKMNKNAQQAQKETSKGANGTIQPTCNHLGGRMTLLQEYEDCQGVLYYCCGCPTDVHFWVFQH